MLKNLKSEITVNQRVLRQFAWLMAVMLGLVVPLIVVWVNDWQLVRAAWIISGLGVLFLLAGLLAPARLKPVYILWMLLALVLGTIVTRIVITIVFYLMITPIGWVRRTFTIRDPLGLRPDPSRDT
ncbi:MAG: SxtJ family membrane protein, partial [Bacteroidota bacterium]